MITLSYNHIIDNLYKIQTKDGKLSTTRINAKNNKDIKDSILYLTSFLPQERSIAERVYCIINNITEIPICDITKTPLKWNPQTKKYSRSYKSGIANRVQNSQPIKDRYKTIAHTLQTKYKSNDYTLIDPLCFVDNYKHNIKLWDIEKNYDLFCSILKLTSFLPKESNWGERFFCIKNNMRERVISIDGGYAKYINSSIGYSKYSTKKTKHIHDINYIRSEVLKNFDILDDISNINTQKSVRVRCKKCNTEKDQLFICGLWQDIVCRGCTGSGRSKAEDEILDFLRSYNVETIQNTKLDGIEVDILIPSKNIGIEYNGILWHSIGTTYPNNIDREKYFRKIHKLKKSICVSNNINLISIFENEWITKQDIVKSIILSKLNLLPYKVFARKCEVVILSREEKKEFYTVNHIQGNCQSFIDYGLKYNNEIYAAMSFSRRKINKNEDIELVRFCCKLNTNVVGGFSRLLKRAESDLKRDIISYCDLRYSNGNTYIKNGFTLLRESPPNYFYTKDNITLKSRMMFQKHKLKDYDNYDDSKSESQIMYEAGWRKIYDCGNLVFKFVNKNSKKT